MSRNVRILTACLFFLILQLALANDGVRMFIDGRMIFEDPPVPL